MVNIKAREYGIIEDLGDSCVEGEGGGIGGLGSTLNLSIYSSCKGVLEPSILKDNL